MIQFENAVERYKKIILAELKELEITCWVAGGCIRDYFMGVKIKTDYDLFFPDQTHYDAAAQHFKNKGAKIIWESDNGMKVRYNGRVFDLIKKFFADPQETINQFDFTCSMLAVDENRVYHGETTFIDLAKRQLMIHKITYPPSTLSRAFRYHHKGFSICQGEMLKIIEALQAMPKPEPKEEPNPITGDVAPPSGGQSDFFHGID